MARKLTYACALLAVMVLGASCTDDIFDGIFSDDGIVLQVAVNMPGTSSLATRATKTRVGTDNQHCDQTDTSTESQRYIADGDIHVLVFGNDGDEAAPQWKLYAVPAISDISGSNGESTRTITCHLPKPAETKAIIVDVVANLVENGITDIDFKGMIGQPRECVYSTVGTFAHPISSKDNPYGVWNLQATDASGIVTAHRYLPMWGQSSTTPTINSSTGEISVTCGLYRSVAKLGVLVDEGCTTFDLREIYVYYPNNDGTFVSIPVDGVNWNPSVNVQYTIPEVPEGTSARAVGYPLVYTMASPIGAGGSYTDNIYVPEADNKKNTGNPVCLVVGGFYKGGKYGGEGLDDGHINYYRIDLESLPTGAGGGAEAFDLVRNHSYLFNILNANNPGTSDPDPRSAAAGLEVEVLDYTEVPIHGINSQYTLTVNRSLFAFEGATTDVGELIVNTDGTGWELVTEWSTDEGYPENGHAPDWVMLTDPGEHKNVDDVVKIGVTANANNTSLRNGSFWIKCGKVLKKIDIVQDHVETGNSYVVTAPGTYNLKVDIRGNGRTYAKNNEAGTDSIAIDFGMGSSIKGISYASVIWETEPGFVTIPAGQATSESGCISYEVHDKELTNDWAGNGKVFDKGNGANALIGVFSEDGTLLWSYHIWGIGDYADKGVLTEKWRVGSDGNSYYEFMDRNLGAYSNLPGSKSFGLLYQWGRKDPFIGAYREADKDGNYERDYRQVRKQYTKHYPVRKDASGGNGYYVWGNHDDSNVPGSEEGSLDAFTIQNPTTILVNGLLSAVHNSAEAHGLWGTTNYAYDNSDAGNKTMYDPCPAGYRVPSLNALTIYDGRNNMWTGTNAQGVQHSSYTARFVPIKSGDSYRTQREYTASFVSDAPFYGFWFDYGGMAGFASTYERNDAVGYGAHYYDSETLRNGSCGWMTGYSSSNPGKPEGVTWLPMAGIYNGTMNHFGRAGLTDRMASEPYLPASSLQVTSVLWANSPTRNTAGGGNYPAGLLLHGTEGAYAPHYGYGSGTGKGTTYQYSPGEYESASGVTANTVATEGEGYWHSGTASWSKSAAGWWTGSVDAGKESMDSDIPEGQWNYSLGNESIADASSWYDENGLAGGGRHFHSYADPTISTLANPSYAASVRCIRDKDAVVHQEDVICDGDGNNVEGKTLVLYGLDAGGDQDAIDLAIMFGGEWEVVSPGAKWVSISPASGTTTNPSGAISEISITYLEDYLPKEVPATATATIRFARGKTATITIQYVGGQNN